MELEQQMARERQELKEGHMREMDTLVSELTELRAKMREGRHEKEQVCNGMERDGTGCEGGHEK